MNDDVDIRKVQQTGNGISYIYLPNKWATEAGLSKGDSLQIRITSNDTLIIRTSRKLDNPEIREIVVDDTVDDLLWTMKSSCLIGLRAVTYKPSKDKSFTKDQYHEGLRFIRNLAVRCTLQDIQMDRNALGYVDTTDYSKIEPINNLKQILKSVETSFEQVKVLLDKINDKSTVIQMMKQIAENEKQWIDPLFFYIRRASFIRLTELMVAQSDDAFTSTMVELIERIGDNIHHMARHLSLKWIDFLKIESDSAFIDMSDDIVNTKFTKIPTILEKKEMSAVKEVAMSFLSETIDYFEKLREIILQKNGKEAKVCRDKIKIKIANLDKEFANKIGSSSLSTCSYCNLVMHDLRSIFSNLEISFTRVVGYYYYSPNSMPIKR